MRAFMPCLWLDRDVAGARDYYRSVFEGARVVDEMVAGAGAPFPAGTVISTVLEFGGGSLMLLHGARTKPTEALSLVVTCEEQGEIDRLWARLSDGGEEQMCGWVKDRYAVSWQIVPGVLQRLLRDDDRARSGRAMHAMLQMRKLDIAALTAAHRGET